MSREQPGRLFEHLNLSELIVIGVVGAVMMTGVTFMRDYINPPRKDPYTSIDAQRDRERDRERIETALNNLASEVATLNQNERAFRAEMQEAIHAITLRITELPPKKWQEKIDHNTEFRLRHQAREDLHGLGGP